jgi:hypothetical protein
MGIWRKNADGTDINSVDVCKDLGVVATGDDSGMFIYLYVYMNKCMFIH